MNTERIEGPKNTSREKIDAIYLLIAQVKLSPVTEALSALACLLCWLISTIAGGKEIEFVEAGITGPEV